MRDPGGRARGPAAAGRMILQIILLGLASAIRPSSLVAVYAILRESSPVRPMVAYVSAGLVFTLTVGALVVWAFSGVELHAGSDETKAIAELAGGMLALGLAAGILTGKVRVSRDGDAPRPPGRLARLQHRQMTTRTAALAGPATHLPGLFYLLALDLIVSREPAPAGGLIDLGIFNALWFALPILALAVCIFDPLAARLRVQSVEEWGAANARAIVLVIALGVGVWLLIKGALAV